jgi:hypothetical protein
LWESGDLRMPRCPIEKAVQILDRINAKASSVTTRTGEQHEPLSITDSGEIVLK